MPGLTFDQVSKEFPGGTVAVRDLSLAIADGEFMIFVGPSGCGKTTALRMVAGLEKITSGTISIGDRVINDDSPRDRDIAMVFQNYALYPHMTVYKNLAFGLKERKMPKDEIAIRVNGVSSMLDRSICSHVGRRNCPAASVSASRWGGRWSASPRRS
jgi:ABC-type sugar transport system ATPase subunit